ncbi:MAG TPA: hypothetical protein VGE01_02430, partial [Fimbriimonas sp.]
MERMVEGIDTNVSVLALWREAGQWWLNEPPLEVCRFVDAKGAWREMVHPMPPYGAESALPKREGKIRNEKWNAAYGALPPWYYERRDQEKQRLETSWSVNVRG